MATNVFVHGYMGWGSYDAQYKAMPYWGMFTGDLLKRLRKEGFECYAASVKPQGSAWDRACELYAQLTGTRTDYGALHAARFHHDRYGPDFTGKPLVPVWDAEHPINLFGHSFGGPTVLYFAELMTNGQRAEAAQPDASPFFKGGHADWLHSVVTLAGTNNGTTMVGATGGTPDTAIYDMAIDHAVSVNRTMRLDPDTYYFACPCDTTTRQSDGSLRMDESKTEKAFVQTGNQMVRSRGVTPLGVVIDESWAHNDGLVNSVAAGAPFGQPKKDLSTGDFLQALPEVEPGLWNVFPPYDGDHMSQMGGFFKRNKDVDRYYRDLITLLDFLK
ncbi:MAG: hypothetical protein IJ714_05605 [Bacteroidales bacterium]|nr:hypothetical protein [Clostridia bacterium]MBR1699241.1 hypothetical protein [Bacteroidales bacterium]